MVISSSCRTRRLSSRAALQLAKAHNMNVVRYIHFEILCPVPRFPGLDLLSWDCYFNWVIHQWLLAIKHSCAMRRIVIILLWIHAAHSAKGYLPWAFRNTLELDYSKRILKPSRWHLRRIFFQKRSPDSCSLILFIPCCLILFWHFTFYG